MLNIWHLLFVCVHLYYEPFYMMILYVSMQNDFDRLTVGEIYGEFS